MATPLSVKPVRLIMPSSRLPPEASDQSVVSHSVQVAGSPDRPTSTREALLICRAVCMVEMSDAGCPVGFTHWAMVNVAQTMLKLPRLQAGVFEKDMVIFGIADA